MVRGMLLMEIIQPVSISGKPASAQYKYKTGQYL